MAQTTQNDNSGMGMVLGILLVVVLAAGAYFFFKSENGNVDTVNNTTIEAPATTSSDGTTPNATAPAAGDTTTPSDNGSVAP